MAKTLPQEAYQLGRMSLAFALSELYRHGIDVDPHWPTGNNSRITINRRGGPAVIQVRTARRNETMLQVFRGKGETLTAGTTGKTLADFYLIVDHGRRGPDYYILNKREVERVAKRTDAKPPYRWIMRDDFEQEKHRNAWRKLSRRS